jgi:CBS domain-containing protein
MKLRDIMTTDFCCASPSDSLSKVGSEMKRHNVGIMPVCQNGNLVGVITDRDIVVQCVAAGVDPKDCKVGSFMTKELIQASPDMDIGDAARLMGDEQVRRLPVVEGGRLVGMVSIGDLAVHSQDDKMIAGVLREISMPVRSVKMEAIAA